MRYIATLLFFLISHEARTQNYHLPSELYYTKFTNQAPYDCLNYKLSKIQFDKSVNLTALKDQKARIKNKFCFIYNSVTHDIKTRHKLYLRENYNLLKENLSNIESITNKSFLNPMEFSILLKSFEDSLYQNASISIPNITPNNSISYLKAKESSAPLEMLPYITFFLLIFFFFFQKAAWKPQVPLLLTIFIALSLAISFQYKNAHKNYITNIYEDFLEKYNFQSINIANELAPIIVNFSQSYKYNHLPFSQKELKEIKNTKELFNKIDHSRKTTFAIKNAIVKKYLLQSINFFAIVFICLNIFSLFFLFLSIHRAKKIVSSMKS